MFLSLKSRELEFFSFFIINENGPISPDTGELVLKSISLNNNAANYSYLPGKLRGWAVHAVMRKGCKPEKINK